MDAEIEALMPIGLPPERRTLYDSYIRAIRWASLRIRTGGLVAFVTKRWLADSNTADGMRLTLADEFSDIYVLNLRGKPDGRLANNRKREGGKVFGGGSRATVAVTLLMDPTDPAGARIHYTDIGDHLNREDSWRRPTGRAQALNPSRSRPRR